MEIQRYLFPVNLPISLALLPVADHLRLTARRVCYCILGSFDMQQ